MVSEIFHITQRFESVQSQLTMTVHTHLQRIVCTYMPPLTLASCR